MKPGILVLLLCARPAAASEMRIAVMEFTNTSPGGEMDALGKGLQSMFSTDLAQVAAFRLVERERLKDIQSELKLSRSVEVDKTTAVHIGKLAGATHLFSGTFTVVGDKMRIDGRLLSVETGDVLLAEKIEGDKAAFFELEKSLVKKVVDAAGVKLQPKERAVMAHVQTADFEAFHKFSQGVAAFDEKRYQDAIARLNEAKNLDKDFTLASLTLDEYQKIADKLRDKAGAIQSAQDEVARLSKEKERKEHSEQLDKLWALAAKKGGGIDRLAAIYQLACTYWRLADGKGDRFALGRTLSALAGSYYAEAVPLFPKIPPFISCSFATRDAATMDPRAFSDRLQHYGGEKNPDRNLYLAEDMEEWRRAARDLMLDERQEVHLADQIYRLTLQLNPPPETKARLGLNLARAYTGVLELDRSTALYIELSKQEKSQYKLRSLASEIEGNGEIAKLTGNPFTREYMLLHNHHADDRARAATLFPGGKSTPEGLHELTLNRRFPRGAYLWIGESPVWRAGRDETLLNDLVTGARTVDPRRAEELRYYPSTRLWKMNSRPGAPHGATLIVDGNPRREIELRAHVDFKPAADFSQPDESPEYADRPDNQLDPRRPEVGFVFALENVDAKPLPMTGLALLVSENAVRLYELKGEDWAVKQEQKSDWRAARKLELAAKLAGDTLTATVNGKSFSFKVAGEHNGYYGLQTRGFGYAALSGLKAIRGK